MAEAPWKPPGDYLPGCYRHYRLGRLLGSGGFGVVYQATSTDHPGCDLAIKFLHGRSSEELDLFWEEARVSVGLNHQYLAKSFNLLHLDEHTGEGWPPRALVMSCYLPPLHAVIKACNRARVLPADLVAEWCKQLAETLAYLHEPRGMEPGIVHRDVKPSNILLDLQPGKRWQGTNPQALRGATVKLSDLGLCARIGSASKYRPGQDGWKAPEVERLADYKPHPAEDVYALGLIFQQLAEVVQGGPFWLGEVAAGCLNENPARRPAAVELIERFKIHWQQQTVLVRGPGPCSIDALREAGWMPEQHQGFVGRHFVFEAFDEFARNRQERGGVFLVVGPSGVGKTALLTSWASRRGAAAGFYYRYRDGRVSAAEMPRQLLRQLGVEGEVPEALLTSRLECRLRETPAGPETGRRLLFIDALDEADDPARAATFVPKNLPPNTFVIVSSRPTAGGGQDHLASLVAAGARQFLLEADSQANLADVVAFFQERCQLSPENGQAQALAERTGGTFLLATLLAESLADGSMSVDEALAPAHGWAQLPPSERLFSYYQESWNRLCLGIDDNLLTLLTDFARLLAGFLGWVSEQQVWEMLDWIDRCQRGHAGSRWTVDRFNQVVRKLSWLLDRRNREGSGPAGYLQIRHQSVRDYLTACGGPAHLKMRSVDQAIGDYYLRPERPDWQEVDSYGRTFAVRHLLRVGDRQHVEAAIHLLTDLNYLQATVGQEPPGIPASGNSTPTGGDS